MLDLNRSMFDNIMDGVVGVPHRHRVDVAVIDTSLADWQTLRDGVKAGTEIVLVGGHEDGLLALARALDGRVGIDAIHVLSHGFAGGLVVGSVTLDVTTLESHRACLAAIGRCLSDDADILLYSCHTASGRGRDFLAGLADITGARVAASYNLTGAAALGGDWVLGYRSGDMELSIPLETAVINGYQHTLSQPTYSSATGYIGESTFALSFDLALSATSPPLPGSFSVQVNGTGVTVGSVAVTGNNVTLTLQNTTLTAGDIIEFSYTDPTAGNDINAIQGLDGTDAATFSSSTIVFGGRPLSAPTLSATGGPHTFNQGATTGVDLFSSVTADTNDPNQTITGFTMTVSNVSDTLEFIGGFGPGISLANGSSGSVGDPNSGGGAGTVTGSGSTKTLTVTGLNLSDSAFDSLINNLEYFNSAGTVTPGPRVITITEVTDSGSSNNAAAPSNIFATVNVSATAPVPIVTETLFNDIGSSATDNITNDAALSGTGNANAVVTLTESTIVLGTTTANGTGAWTFTPTLTDGVHTVVAHETNGNGTGTATLTFTLDTVAPVVTETLTTDTGSSNSDNLTNDPTLSGTADANASVLFTEGATVLGSTPVNSAGDWTFAPTLSDGTHTIVASETDVAGNTGTSTFAFTLDTTAPAMPVITSPNLTDNPTPVITGTAEAGTAIRVGVNAAVYTTTAVAGVWSIDLATATPDSGNPLLQTNNSNLIQVRATDTAGNQSSETDQVLRIDTTAPAVTAALTTDTGSSNSDGITTNPALSGTGDANIGVTLTEGTTVIGETTSDNSGAWSFTPTLSDGVHTVVAHEVDSAGNIGSTTFTFTLDTVVPVVTAALLDDTGSSNSDGITSNAMLTGTGKPNTVVTIIQGTTVLLGSTTVNSSGVWTFTPTLPDGSYTLFADDADTAGNIDAHSISITLNTAAPPVTGSLALAAGSDSGVPGDGITNVTMPTLTGTGETGDTLTLYDGTVAIGTTTIVNGGWSLTPSVALLAGSHALTARQTNIAGNMSTSDLLPLPLIIDTTLPAVPSGIALAAASDSGVVGDGITSVTSPLITGSGVAGDTVKLYDGTTLLGLSTVVAGGTWSFTPTAALANGLHSLTATQTSPAGNVSVASTALALTIDTVAPIVTAALAANPHNSSTTGAVYNQVLNGGGDPNASVIIRDGSVVVGTAVADATSAWSLDLAALAAGSHSLIASETDAAGNTGAGTAVPLTVAATVVPDTRFTLATGNIATSGAFFGSDYTGAAGHLQAQYGYVGTANVSVIANVANAFIYGGGGNDAIVAKAGSNVLDGAGGSNWMIGASGTDGGTDTFFVDNRSSQNTWNTLLNFHVGDMLTVWDFNPAAGSVNFADNLGQPGYTGLTLQAGLGNGTGATDLATFAGLSSGTAHLVTSTGTSGGLSYLAVTRVA